MKNFVKVNVDFKSTCACARSPNEFSGEWCVRVPYGQVKMIPRRVYKKWCALRSTLVVTTLDYLCVDKKGAQAITFKNRRPFSAVHDYELIASISANFCFFLNYRI